MSANTTIHLRDTEEFSVSLMELEINKCVALSITVKDGYRRMSEITIVSDSPEQEEALRVLAQAWHEYKATLKQIASL